MESTLKAKDGFLIINPQQLSQGALRELSNCNETVFMPKERLSPKPMTKSRSVPNFLKKFLPKSNSEIQDTPEENDMAPTVTYVTPSGEMTELMDKLNSQVHSTPTTPEQRYSPRIALLSVDSARKAGKKKQRKKLIQFRSQTAPTTSDVNSNTRLVPVTDHSPQNSLSDATDLSDNDGSSSKFSDLSDSDDSLSLSSDGTGHVNSIFQFDEKFESNKSVSKEYATFGKKGKGSGELEDATDITYLGKGRIIVTDLVNNRLQTFDKNGRGNVSYALKEIVEPWAATLTPSGYIAVTSKKEQCVVVFSRDGNVITSFGHDTCICPSGIAIDKQNNYLVTDLASKNVIIYDTDGKFLSKIESKVGFGQPRYITVSNQGEILVSDSGDHSVKVFNSDGDHIRTIGKFGRRDGQFKSPHGVCTDRAGNIFVADHYNDRISVFNQDGDFIRHLITPNNGLVHPQALALSKDYKLYVSHGDLKAHEIIVFTLKQPAEDVENTSAEVYNV